MSAFGDGRDRALPGRFLDFERHGGVWRDRIASRDRLRAEPDAAAPLGLKFDLAALVKAPAPDRNIGKFERLLILRNLPWVLTSKVRTQSKTPLRPAPAPRRRNSQVAMTFEKSFASL